MSRRKVYKLSALTVLLCMVGFTWGRNAPSPDSGGQQTEFPDLWQWDLTRLPPPDGTGLKLVLRTRHFPITEPAPVPISVPLRENQGVDKVIGSDTMGRIIDHQPVMGFIFV